MHLIYPHRRIGTTPDAIGWQLADRLSAEVEVLLYDWNCHDKIRPRPGDILIGHPHPVPMTILRRSWGDMNWSRRYLLCPMIPHIQTVGFLDDLVRTCDSFFAFMGVPWYETVEFSAFRSWLPKIARLDLGVDRISYPKIKTAFAPKGRRAILYVGNTSRAKGIEYLESLAKASPAWRFGWMGSGEQISGFYSHGFQRTDQEEARMIAAEYDFFLSTGTADANPTTVLEAMSWGLVPFTTRTSGYDSRDGVVSLPMDPSAGLELLTSYQYIEESELLRRQAENFSRLESRFSWSKIVEGISREVIAGASRTGPSTGAAERFQMSIGTYTSRSLYRGTWQQLRSYSPL